MKGRPQPSARRPGGRGECSIGERQAVDAFKSWCFGYNLAPITTSAGVGSDRTSVSGFGITPRVVMYATLSPLCGSRDVGGSALRGDAILGTTRGIRTSERPG